MKILLVFVTSLIATVLSSMSGGGTSIITFPIFLSLGIPIPLILAINTVNGMFWVLPASINYLKGRIFHLKFYIIFSIIGLLGAYFGLKTALNLNQQVFQTIVGIIIVALVFYTYFKKDLGLIETKVYSPIRQALIYPFALILGFYETFFGSGNGIMFSLISFYTKGFDFIDALGHYYAITFPWLILATIVFIEKGIYDIPLMFFAVVGSLIGSYIGSKYAKYKGNKFIKISFIIIGTMLGLKLLLGL